MKGWYYKTTHGNTSRFVLGTKGQKPLICFGMNPSTATPKLLDNTLKSIGRISMNNGYDSWIMLNIYPQRSTDPNALDGMLDKEIHRLNLIY